MNGKSTEMVGKKYGRLTVIGIDEKEKLLCRCDCGITKSIYASNVISGKTRSCGCLWKENLQSFKHDLKGQRFGKLMVLEETEIRKDGCVVWKCLCDCGNIHFVSSKVLLRKEVKSCGCLRHELSNVLGQRFEKLVVIEEAEMSNRKRRMWLCQCDCGRKIIVDGSNLRNGHTRSCGCLKKTEQLQFVDGTSISIISSKKLSKNNKSGVRGVSFNKRTGKWVARLTFKRHVYCLGEYVKFEDAVKARKKKEKVYEDFIKEYQKKA